MKINKIKTIFFGTSEFAVACFEALLDIEQIDLVAVVTQPDKPAGRKMELKPPLLKQFILENKINVDILQPLSIKKEGQNILEKYTPELIVVAQYGQIIPKNILNYPKFKCLNVHGSILPKLRGAVPIQMAILQGLDETGITIQRMVYEMDKGPIIFVKKCAIEKNETYESLLAKLSILANLSLKESLPKWLNGELREVEQDDKKATYCYVSDVSKDKAQIFFETPVIQAERMVRAFYPQPAAWVNLDGKRMKIFKASLSDGFNQKFNQIQLVNFKKELYITLIDGNLKLIEIQFEGKNKASTKNYLNIAKLIQ
ncbi:MAG: methionyl-tRNA formyltransferase [Candidatus Dojkabacteria bacterium]|nr:MAG: methionyl-tRNA formyltransferase [Candidatus Dojkabacteria bacterium]GIV45079.1 MAG: methionyl-tRNA formyltransferase [Bacteroidia bacterium]GIV45084.1 MAG: methionyl-tRNA formyltransferase [Bacteroidia bacterium]